ncbi:MAG: alpha/beta hydrolase [Deltaproteobacteria bacterium]|nr:alpha/beta hydrolase [Deltaproteobacteria bacterium]MBW2415657.1 alpha/beta hydrolase [Deltaproteobacteria bacterium]
MAYDPFSRGPLPVGVRSFEVKDASRDRTLPVEFWYPASDAHAGQDLDEATQDKFQPMPMAPEVSQAAVRDAAPHDGTRPALVVFSHGYGGERRQTTHFCTHLASHGYAVASMDHVGNTMADTFQAAMQSQAGEAMPDLAETIARFIEDRPADTSFVIDRVLAGDGAVQVDAERIGITGHSFGGWTTLETTGRDRRIRAALPLAPAGGASGLTEAAGAGNPLQESLSLEWDREVPTLYLVAEFDTLLPLDGMRGLIARTPAPCRAVVLRNSDHFHFCDNVEQTHDMFKAMAPLMAASGSAAGVDTTGMFESMKSSADLCPGDHAYAMIQGLGLAHMDAHLRGDAEAAELLTGDLAALLGERGIDAEGIG